jgi:hypothetical protein
LRLEEPPVLPREDAPARPREAGRLWERPRLAAPRPRERLPFEDALRPEAADELDLDELDLDAAFEDPVAPATRARASCCPPLPFLRALDALPFCGLLRFVLERCLVPEP